MIPRPVKRPLIAETTNTTSTMQVIVNTGSGKPRLMTLPPTPVWVGDKPWAEVKAALENAESYANQSL